MELDCWRGADDGMESLNEFCGVGIRALSQFEHVVYAPKTAGAAEEGGPGQQHAPPVEAYGYFHAVFRTRLLGRAAIKRRLRCYQDFIDLREGAGTAKLLGPISAVHSGDAHGRLRGLDLVAALQQLCLNDVRPRLLDGPPDPWPIDRIPGRNLVDHALVEGLYRPVGTLKAGSAWEAVRMSLIGSPGSEADEGAAAVHLEENRHFIRRFVESFFGRDPDDFDRWLSVESGKAFVRLLTDGHKLRGFAKAEAREMAQAFYRRQLWAAYQQMSRAYGALMMIIWLDLCEDATLRPTVVEQQLFSAMHRPQFYLGGLPLAFFGPPQLQWFLVPLLQLWAREQFDPQTYDVLNKLLGLYGATVAERRAADRELKAEQRARRRGAGQDTSPTLRRGVVQAQDEDDCSGSPTAEVTPIHHDPAVQLDDINDFPEITPLTRVCHCREPLRWLKRERFDERWILVEVECPNCHKSWWARFESKEGPAGS
jgi:hypothetical protein